jgi:voltage-gated potassium channel
MPLWILSTGVLMMALTVAIHAYGATKWLGFVVTWHNGWEAVDRTRDLYQAVISTAVVLLLLHFSEIVLWAVFYILLPDNAGLADINEAIYFSMVTFTTVGYGDVTLKVGWQLLGGMEAMVGITVFGLTTALLFSVLQRLQLVHHPASHDQ